MLGQPLGNGVVISLVGNPNPGNTDNGSETTIKPLIKVKKVKIKEFSVTLEIQRSREAEFRVPEEQRSGVWSSGKVEKQRNKEKKMKEERNKVAELQSYGETE